MNRKRVKRAGLLVLIVCLFVGGLAFLARLQLGSSDPASTEEAVIPESFKGESYVGMTEAEMEAQSAQALAEADRPSTEQSKAEAEEEYGPLEWVGESNTCFDEEGNFYYLTEGRLLLQMTAEEVSDYGREELIEDALGH